MVDKISVGIPYTVPLETGNWTEYTKGSAHWLKTLDEFIRDTDKFDTFLLGAAYEGIEPINRKRHNLPIVYSPPSTFSKELKSIPPSDNIDVRAPIHGFTLGDDYSLTSSAGPREFRAITEVTRWYLDMMPALFGLDHFDVVFPQHMSWNMIASAHYAAMGKAIGISHETCARCDMDNGEGGWAAEKLRPHILHAFDVHDGQTKVIAISGMVKKMLTEAPGGPRLPADRVIERTNAYNEKIYFPINGMSRARFVTEYLNEEFKDDFRKKFNREFEDVPIDGKWLVFVGRGAEFKGVEQLLRSWAVRLRRRYPHRNSKDVLFVIGPDTNGPQFTQYAEELGIADNVRFLGARDPAKFINPLYNAADLAAMTSLNEGDGVVVKQPGGTGLRVVASDSGGPAEYMSDLMGSKTKSRDPSEKFSKARGLALLIGKRKIVWGDKILSGADIVRHHIQWQQFYGKDIKDKKVSAKRKEDIARLKGIADDWNGSARIRNFAARLLSSEITESAVPSIPPQDMEFHKNVELLAEVFKIFGGMDVEANSLASAYEEEFNAAPEMRSALESLAYHHAINTFSSSAYVDWLTPLLKEAAERPFDPSAVSIRPVEDTVISSMEVDNYAAGAFRAWQAAETPEELVGAVTAFNRAVVSYLGNLSNYDEEHWPTPEEMAMRDPRRSSKVAARIAGVSVREYEQNRQRLITNAQANPNLQSALYMAQIGQANPAILPAAISAATLAVSPALIH